MRSAPARRAADVGLASASSAVVCATALAKAGAASVVLFITFPPLSRPRQTARDDENPSPLVSASATKRLNRSTAFAGRVTQTHAAPSDARTARRTRRPPAPASRE